MSYPKITDKNFYDKITNKYKKYKIKKSNKSYDQWCFPKQYTLQLPQQFLANFISPNTPYMDILVYHKIGSGKTCAMIQMCEKWKKYKRIIVVLPASLRGNFRNELRSLCVGNTYLTDNERTRLSKLEPTDEEYMDIIDKSDERIDKYYEIYSYNKFIEMIKDETLNLKNAFLGIDEIQNMISEDGTYYWTLYNAIKKAPKDLRIALLSATPMFDKPSELALTLNLLRLPKELPVGNEFNKIFIKTTKSKDGVLNYKFRNIELFKSYIKGYISYFMGAPNHVFPHTIIKYIRCEMSDFQYSAYKKISEYEETYKNELSNDFYIGTRMISNVVYPNKTLDEKGFDLFTKKLIRKDLEKYSCKFAKIMEKINKTGGKVFVYSNFIEYGGIQSFIKVLEAYGYSNYFKTGVGKKRFAIWSGNETMAMKDEIRNVYNQKNNINGSKIKVLVASASIKEGVSLLHVKHAHIIDGYWNWSRMAQIIGRVARFCSHKDLPEEKRNVKIYLYLAVVQEDKNIKNIETIDEYMKHLAHSKHKLIKQFEKAIKESSIDCTLNYNANQNDEDEEYKCDK
ncbi:DEXDc helicase [Bodo saltans virus]|uniref:DEXDc helicase n=1 Tax=Bodo saltans virus TaxID=2024608 RepID=A0A2H4UVG8_9VIRU|nr:DEXDc helicase [Bodo saltans virus]ATZ80825.1 DEXDc helicase [Bodo saltans virus]